MSVGFSTLGCGSFADTIRTKADAMKYALEGTAEYAGGTKVYHHDKAKELFDFFCEHVVLIDTDVVPLTELIDSSFEKLKEYVEFIRSESKEKAG
jgi:hypothetical protein